MDVTRRDFLKLLAFSLATAAVIQAGEEQAHAAVTQAQRQIPGGAYVNETTTGREQIPGGMYINEAQSVIASCPKNLALMGVGC